MENRTSRWSIPLIVEFLLTSPRIINWPQAQWQVSQLPLPPLSSTQVSQMWAMTLPSLLCSPSQESSLEGSGFFLSGTFLWSSWPSPQPPLTLQLTDPKFLAWKVFFLTLLFYRARKSKLLAIAARAFNMVMVILFQPPFIQASFQRLKYTLKSQALCYSWFSQPLRVRHFEGFFTCSLQGNKGN